MSKMQKVIAKYSNKDTISPVTVLAATDWKEANDHRHSQASDPGAMVLNGSNWAIYVKQVGARKTYTKWWAYFEYKVVDASSSGFTGPQYKSVKATGKTLGWPDIGDAVGFLNDSMTEREKTIADSLRHVKSVRASLKRANTSGL